MGRHTSFLVPMGESCGTFAEGNSALPLMRHGPDRHQHDSPRNRVLRLPVSTTGFLSGLH